MNYTGITLKSSASITTAVSPISDNTASIGGRRSISFPLHALAGDLYVLICPSDRLLNGVAITSTDIQNYGTKWSSSDKVCQINVAQFCDVVAVVSAGSFTVYPSEWS